MRPTLTLKKKTAPAPADTIPPATQPAEPVKASEPIAPAETPQPANAAKPAKLSPQEAKAAREALAEANRLLGQELSARRRASSEKVKPLLAAYLADKAILRETVLVDGVECLRPLAVGIHKTLFAWLREQPDAQGASNTLLMDLIKSVLGPHVTQPRYLAGLLNCQDRFDLDGAVAGPVADKQKVRADKAWRKLQQQPAAQPA